MKIYMIFLMLMGTLNSSAVKAQEDEVSIAVVNEDDLGNVTDAFQESFFEALKQKAIENYEKAIDALKECEKMQPENPVVHFELGKNYKFLENYNAAISSFQKANRLQPNKEWVLVELMEAFYANKTYDEAIIIAKKLISFNNRYYNDLADLYFKLERYEDLLVLLDKLDVELGIDEYRLGLRQQIYSLTNNTTAQIDVLKEAIKANPEKEMNYLNLIFVYSEQKMEKEAFEAARDMKEKFPGSTVVHLALYKFYLESGNTTEALNSMKTVFKAEEIDAESKLKVLNDFLLFVNENPEYEPDLKEVTALFSKNENSPEVYQKLGEYFLLKNQKQQALDFFKLGIGRDLDNFPLLKNTVLLQLDLSHFEEAATLSAKALDIFPAQPELYLLRGAALNELQKYKDAVEILTFGLDYVLDEQMTGDFYEQLVIAYSGMGNIAKAEEFQNMIKEKNKK